MGFFFRKSGEKPWKNGVRRVFFLQGEVEIARPSTPAQYLGPMMGRGMGFRWSPPIYIICIYIYTSLLLLLLSS